MFEDNYRQRGLRNKLVKKLREKGISDEKILTAIGKVPRHYFFENALLEHAYQDKAFPIGQGQTISQPYTVAFQTEKLEVKPGHKVLEIGTGSGYQTAVLAGLAAHVWTIERHAALAHAARERIAALGFTNVTVIVGDGTEGYAPGAPYDRILVTAGAPRVPGALEAQLAIGGRMVIPVGSAWHQDLQVIDRTPDGLRSEVGDACVFVPLVGREGWPE